MIRKVTAGVMLLLAAAVNAVENPATEQLPGLWMPQGVAVNDAKSGSVAVSSGNIRGNYPSMTLSFMPVDLSAPDAKLKLYVKVDTPDQDWHLSVRLYSADGDGWFAWQSSRRPTHQGAMDWRQIEIPVARMNKFKNADLTRINQIMVLGDKIIARPRPVTVFTIDGLEIEANGQPVELKQNMSEDSVTETPPAGVWNPQAKIVPSELNIGKNAISSGVITGNYPTFTLRIPERDLSDPDLKFCFYAKVNTTGNNWSLSVRFSSLASDGFKGWDTQKHSGNMSWRKFEIPVKALGAYKTTDMTKTVKITFAGGRIYDRDKRKHRTEFIIDGLRLEKDGRIIKLFDAGSYSYYRTAPADVKHPALMYKAQDILRAKENIRRHAWAQQMAADIRTAAKFWMDCPDEKIPFWIPDDGGYHVTCPKCKLNETLKPDETFTRLTCSKCSEVFPSDNYPENHSYTVTTPTGKKRQVFFYKGDDQFIHRENIGNRYHISQLLNFYRLQKLKNLLPVAFVYALDNDRACAEKVRKVLLRLAAVYPDYVPRYRATAYSYGENLMAGKFFSWKLHDSHIITILAQAYDLTCDSGVYSDADKVAIENGIFREYRELMLSTTPEMGDGTRNGAPAHFTAMTNVALLLGEEDLLRLAIDGAVGVKRFIRSYFRRDGSSRENSPAYNNMAVRPLGNVVDVLNANGRNIAAEIPELRDMFRVVARTVMPPGTTLPVGDSYQITPYRMSDAELNYRLFPTQENLQLLNMCMGSAVNYPTYESMFYRDPELRFVPDMPLPWFVRDSLVIAGKECAILRTAASGAGKLPENALVLSFNGQVAHGHNDALNLNYYRFGRELLPDLGYLGHPHHWTPFLRSLLAHNTVIVDGDAQQWKRRVRLTMFSGKDPVQCVSAESANLYPSSELCRRTAVMVNHAPEHNYVVDTVLVNGGTQHDYLIHADGELTAPAGSYQPVEPADIGKPDIGTKYLFSAEKMAVSSDFTALWKSGSGITTGIKFFPDGDGELLKLVTPGLRNKMTPMAEVKMYPVILRKRGAQNHFVTFINAFRDAGNSANAVRLASSKPGTAAMLVKSGKFTDLILIDNSGNEQEMTVMHGDTPVKLCGKVAVITLENGEVSAMSLNSGSRLSYGNTILNGVAALRGTVKSVDPEKHLITAEFTGDIPADPAGQYLIFPDHQDGYYRLEKITPDGKFILHRDETVRVRPGDRFTLDTGVYRSFDIQGKKKEVKK